MQRHNVLSYNVLFSQTLLLNNRNNNDTKTMAKQVTGLNVVEKTELCLDPPDTLDPCLDYEYSIHSLHSKPTRAYRVVEKRKPAANLVLPAQTARSTNSSGVSGKPNIHVRLTGNTRAEETRKKPAKRRWSPIAVPEEEYTIGTWHKMPIRQEDWNQARQYDVLDLHRMAERLYDRRVNNDVAARGISDVDREVYAELLSMAAYNDRQLKQAYGKLKDKKTPFAERREIRSLIKRLEMLPHLYMPKSREESTKAHVSRWLARQTDTAEAELVGFTSQDPLEPRKFISSVKPRLSSSDTSVVLGKRKRLEIDEDECGSGATDSGSDTLLSEKRDTIRPLALRAKRQRCWVCVND